MIKSRRMRWAGHVAYMGKGEVHTGFWWGKLKEGDHLEDPSLDRMIMLTWICRKWGGRVMNWID